MNERLPDIPTNHPLRDCPAVAIGLQWPAPVSARLDQLVDLARTGAFRETSRKELAAALVLAAPADADELDRLIVEYRAATAGSAMIESSVIHGNVVRLERSRPGPRPVVS